VYLRYISEDLLEALPHRVDRHSCCKMEYLYYLIPCTNSLNVVFKMRDHFGDAERGTSMYKVFLNNLVATSWNAFAGDIAVKSRDAIKLHQEKYNANSVIPHNVLASDYLTDCHQALFFQQDTLVY